MENADNLDFTPDFDTAHAYFRGRTDYEPSPLTQIEGPGGCTVLAKDETNRMGLGAFKALGAPYAVARILDQKWRQKTGEPLTNERLESPEVQEFIATQTFVCASAGNHGIGVASGARDAGANARIHLADTVPEGFAARLRGLGATVVRSGAVYEDSVAAATQDAAEAGDILLADGTWPGYTEIPKWVMEGYCVIAEELRVEFEGLGQWPTHVYLQAGVGGLAAAMAHMIRLNWVEQPELIVVEPLAATCLRDSHKAGTPTRATGPESAMGRLDCKDASVVAWTVLERCNVRYAALSEEEGAAAAQAVSALGIPTTPSGAAGFGALAQEDAKLLGSNVFRPLVVVSERPA